ncbi:hypothetical protein MSAN_01054200 [Mycena sanguinolenta]|uniref:Uncharacterized protein n=1 Tax=Mycena sanguinolenta TaxID=230812 RepID=A0A8H6YRQ9_9AGAR|nr:hypothetical protein MSAN_01054200 [Mycena sanguinolenta]
MTEYTTSSQAIRDYLSSKERTKNWVRSRIDSPDQCYSPNIAPSILQDPDFVPAPASDAGSTHSVPPKMVLRYPDGRPDEPIYEGHHEPSLKRGGSRLRPHESVRSQTLPTPSRSRAGSQSASRGPEEIRILPSHAVNAPRSATHSSHSHTRSKSLPRDAYSQTQEPVPGLPPPRSSHHSHAASGAGHPEPHPRAGPMVSFTQPPPQTWHGSHGRHHPPPIVYAPSHHRSRPHYAPPAMFTHPPPMGPNGMIYSHSAPVPSSHYPQKYPTPYPSVMASSAHMASVNEELRSGSRTPNRRDRSRSRSGTARPSSPASSTSSFNSDGSGSTYYVMPQGRQKVHVIHTPDTSHTSSTSHSPTSPHSKNSLKKPALFQRLLGFAEKRLFSPSSGDSSHGSSRGGRRLQRRHSAGESRRSRSTPPGE